jgi:acyl carrier protein
VSDRSVRSRVLALLVDELGVEGPVADDAELARDLLLDSLAAVELVMVVEDDLEIGLADTTVAGLTTVGDLIDAVEARVAARDARTLGGT